MTPKGLAAAVLAGLPLAYGVQNGELIQNTTFLVVLYSIVLTAVLVFLIEKDIVSGLYRVIFSTYATELPQVSTPLPGQKAELTTGEGENNPGTESYSSSEPPVQLSEDGEISDQK